MKAILRFDLPEDQEEWDLHLDTYRMHALIGEFHTYLRSQIKYTEPKDRHSIQEIYENWCTYRSNHNL